MHILHLLYRNGTWLSPPIIGIGIFLLWFFILNAVRMGNKNLILTVPLCAEQDVVFQEAGQVILCVEGPFLSTRFGNLSFELVGSEGIPMHGQRYWLRPRSTSLSGRARIQLQSFDIRFPGPHILRVKGLGPSRSDDAKHRILFMKPHFLKTIVCILGIIMGAFLAIGGLVLFIYRLLPKENIP